MKITIPLITCAALLALAIAHASLGAQPLEIPELAAPLETPIYPPEARRYGIEGKAIIAVQVLASGTVGRTYVLSTSGFNLLDAEALRIARSARFKPRERNDSGRTGWVRLPIHFILDGPPQATVLTEPIGLAPMPVTERRPITISINRNGLVFVHSNPIGLEDLTTASIGGASLIIRADDDAPFGSIARLIAVAQAAGVRDIKFAVVPAR